MKAIIAVCTDGARHLLFVTSKEFDTQSWANNLREQFKLLQIVRIIEDAA